MPDASWTEEAPDRLHAHPPHAGGDTVNDVSSFDHHPSLRDATIARLRAEIAAKDRLIREHEAALSESRQLFERASAKARIGVWQCRLADEALTWTDAVYDMFDLPRGSVLDRKATLRLYADASLETLHAVRSQALSQRQGFELDAEIVTMAGRRRWIRVTASVECDRGVPSRLFGMKQDITEEKIASDRMRYLAEIDILTGLANRSLFQSRLAALGDPDSRHPPIGTLILIDLDGFKAINDTFGHPLGDECLKETARRLAEVCRDAQLVARIGGDEFAVLLSAEIGRRASEALADRIVKALGRPVERGNGAMRLGASVGIARAEGDVASALFAKADMALYAAKAAGRNTFRVYGEPG